MDADKATCIIEELQSYLHKLLRSYPWRAFDSLDLVLNVDITENNTLKLRIDVNAKGNKPVPPSYDDALARLVDKLREKFEEIVDEGYC